MQINPIDDSSVGQAVRARWDLRGSPASILVTDGSPDVASGSSRAIPTRN